MDVALRIKKERERLGLSRASWGEIASVAEITVVSWERGISAPDLVQLLSLAVVGADMQYILTGTRAGPAVSTHAQNPAGHSVEILSKEEQALLGSYRQAPEPGQAQRPGNGAALA